MFGSCCWIGSKSGFQGEIPSLAVISGELKCCNALCASWHKEIPHKSEGRCRGSTPCAQYNRIFGIFP